MKYNKKHIGHIGIAGATFLCAFFIAQYFVSIPDDSSIMRVQNQKISKISITTVDQKTHVFNVLVADTSALQEKGLGDRDFLPSDEAMLFAFNQNKKHYFWMKDMFFPIDMIWLDSNQQVIHIEKNVATSTYPNSFGPKIPSQYIIEYNAGISDEIHLNVGDKVEFKES